MAVYTFYLCNSGGEAISLEAFELPSDDDVEDRARRMLDEHRSCAYVAVWDVDRAVLTRNRQRADVAASHHALHP
jgi:hypothetical protein